MTREQAFARSFLSATLHFLYHGPDITDLGTRYNLGVDRDAHERLYLAGYR